MHSIATDSVTSLMDFLRAKTPEDWKAIETMDNLSGTLSLRNRRTWKAEDTKEMLNLHSQGNSLACIAAIMDRPETTVNYHWHKNRRKSL